MNTKVICKRGAHPSRLTRVLKAKKRAGERYASITLLVGGNRLKRSDPLSNVTQTAEEVMVTAQAAKAIADHVRVVELTPRLTSDSMLAAIQQLNAEVENKCPENGIEFAKTSGHFWLANGTPNRALIEQQDKIHLTSVGSEILLECLGFKLNNPSDPRKGVKPKDIRPTLPPKQSANRENAAPATSKSPKSKGPGNSKDRKPSQAPRNQGQFRQNTPQAMGRNQGQFRQNTPQAMGGQTRYFTHAGASHGAPVRNQRNTQERNHTNSQAIHGRSAKQPATTYRVNGRSNQYRAATAYTQERNPRQAHGNAWSHHGRNATPTMQECHVSAPSYPWRATIQERSPTVWCNLCNTAGHKPAACRSKDQHCYGCNQMGHFVKACPY